MPAMRPKVTYNFWSRVQAGWRANSHLVANFAEYQSQLLTSGLSLADRDASQFTAALQDRNGHLQPGRKTLSLTVNDAHFERIAQYEAGIYDVQDKNEVAATFVRMGLESS